MRWVAAVVDGEERSGEGLADGAEEGFPAAGGDKAEEFGVGGGDLVGVDRGLLEGGGVSCLVGEVLGLGLGAKAVWCYTEGVRLKIRLCCVTL